jgi:hypothetical protein
MIALRAMVFLAVLVWVRQKFQVDMPRKREVEGLQNDVFVKKFH